MSSVMIKCPATGQPVCTGIETDSETFDGLPDVLSRSTCPLCGVDHSWWKREAWLGVAQRSGDEPRAA